jgi:hypothetical protein
MVHIQGKNPPMSNTKYLGKQYWLKTYLAIIMYHFKAALLKGSFLYIFINILAVRNYTKDTT